MHVRCPHCQNAIEVVGDSDFTDVTCPSCGSSFNLAPETATYHPATKSIGHFQLLEQLGVGGFGTVWKARDTRLDRLVALKIPRRDQIDPADAELFLREARAAAQLRHSGIVSVHEVGRDNGTLYIVSDFVQGATLADRLTAGPFTPREAAELCAQIGEALHHAHESGVIHRDLKPSNIMLDGHGQPHLMDFGLAKREAGEITMTVDGRILGTPAYMSPQQARGEGHRVDRRTDVYSLGVILFELLTGERPFRGNRAMLLHQVLHDEAPSPRKLNSRIPRDLETICLKCLHKSPERRYRTAADMVDDLRRWLEGKSIQARPVGRVERMFRWSRRQPVVASLIGTVAVVTVIGFAAVTWQWHKAVAATAAAKQQLEETERQRSRRKLNFDRAMEAVDRMLTRVGEQQMLSPELASVRKAILEDALKLYKDLLAENADDRVLQAETARAAMRVGAICDLLDDGDKALASYRDAIRLLEMLRTKYPENPDYLLNLANCHYQVAGLQHTEGNRSVAAESLQRAIELVQPRLEMLRGRTVGAVSDIFNDDIDVFMAAAHAHHGQVLFAMDRAEDAAQEIRKAMKYLDFAKDKEAGRNLWWVRMPYFLGILAGYLESVPGSEQEVERLRRQAIELRAASIEILGEAQVISNASPLPGSRFDLDGANSVHGVLANEHEYLAAFLRRTGKKEEAKQHEELASQIRAKSIEKLQEAVAQNATRISKTLKLQALANTYRKQGSLLQRQGQPAEAKEFYRKAFEIYAQLVEEMPDGYMSRRGMLRSALDFLPLVGQDANAWKAEWSFAKELHQRFQEVAASQEEKWELDLLMFRAVQAGCVKTLFQHTSSSQERRRVAELQLREAIIVAERMSQRFSDRSETQDALGWSIHHLGDVFLFHSREPEKSIPFYERACTIREQAIAAHGNSRDRSLHLGWSYANLAHAQSAIRPTADLIRLNLLAVDLHEHCAATDAALLPHVHNLYGRLAAALDQFPPKKDAPDLQKAIDLARSRTAKDPAPGIAWRVLGVALYYQQQNEEAADALGKACRAELSDAAMDRRYLGKCLEQLGRQDEAKLWLAAATNLELLDRSVQGLLATQDPSDWKRKLIEVKQLLEQLDETAPNQAEKWKCNESVFEALKAAVGKTAAQPEPLSSDQAQLLEDQLRESLAVAEQMAGHQPENPDSLNALVFSHHRLGDFRFFRTSNAAEAVGHYRQARVAKEKLIANQGMDSNQAVELGFTVINLAKSLTKGNPSIELIQLNLRAVELLEYCAKTDAKRFESANLRLHLAESHSRLASAFFQWPPEPDDSNLQKAIDMARERTTKDASLGAAWRTLGVALYYQHHYEEAAHALRKASSAKLVDAAFDDLFLAMSLAKLGERKEAEKLLADSSSWISEHQSGNNMLRSLQEDAKRTVRP